MTSLFRLNSYVDGKTDKKKFPSIQMAAQNQLRRSENLSPQNVS